MTGMLNVVVQYHKSDDEYFDEDWSNTIIPVVGDWIDKFGDVYQVVRRVFTYNNVVIIARVLSQLPELGAVIY